MAETTTSQIRDLRDAAERAINWDSSFTIVKGPLPEVHRQYIAKADPTTIKALCTEILRMRGEE